MATLGQGPAAAAAAAAGGAGACEDLRVGDAPWEPVGGMTCGYVEVTGCVWKDTRFKAGYPLAKEACCACGGGRSPPAAGHPPAGGCPALPRLTSVNALLTDETLADVVAGRHSVYGDKPTDAVPNPFTLEDLNGTWVSFTPKGASKTAFGLHTTNMPSPGATPDQLPGKNVFVCENYVEELTFKKVDGAVRNRLGANEQMVGAFEYRQKIVSEGGAGLHEEVGMFLYLGDMFSHPATAETVKRDVGYPELIPGGGKYDVQMPHDSMRFARSGTIPHGNSMLILGGAETKEGKPVFVPGVDDAHPTPATSAKAAKTPLPASWDPAHMAASETMGLNDGLAFDLLAPPQDRPEWVFGKNEENSKKEYIQRIFAHELYPASVRPDLRLRETIRDQKIVSHKVLTLESEPNDGKGPQGGVLSTPLSFRNTPVSRVTFRLWLEEVEEDGQMIKQLQYEQRMLFAFGFGKSGAQTFWPHIQVNTLRLKEE
eukprot:TRINITY_DN280_c0_g2_i1.p1 TRINITY_DN280_c0_g2~~TRINITY_DN280_c0_g2_i1.p1  ORF type:complete len:524 (+),score=180.51 TRINITY_DN280_c0_g2_i1:120-1574(+)